MWTGNHIARNSARFDDAMPTTSPSERFGGGPDPPSPPGEAYRLGADCPEPAACEQCPCAHNGITVPWHLPDSINFPRKPTDPAWDKHLYIEDNGKFRAELKPWEAGVLALELPRSNVVGWLRNVDRQPWSLEIPYESGGQVVPMFPDLVVVPKVGDDYVFNILEPHNPALGDNVEKAVGFAKFAEQHGALFGRIEMLRAGTGAAGKGAFVGLDFNQTNVRKKVMLITSNPQLDALFDSDGK